MNISGTLHFYSGTDRELFFVFDDDLAQELYKDSAFDIDDLETRRVYISVGSDRFIHRRTLSFSRKQTEIKVSLCSRATKDDLGALTSLYDWYAARGRPRPAPFPVIGTFATTTYRGQAGLELRITEPADLVAPPGLKRRKKAQTRQRRSYDHRRRLQQVDLVGVGRPAELLALTIARRDYPDPGHNCLWRDEFLDSKRLEIRRLGIIADIDVWNASRRTPELFIEVKSQKVARHDADPRFYLSVSEWRSYRSARRAGIPYQIWLFQYLRIADFKAAPRDVRLMVFDRTEQEWLAPDGYLVSPAVHGQRFRLRRARNGRGVVRVSTEE